MGKRNFEYSVGCFEIFSYSRKLTQEDWNDLQDKIGLEEWSFNGRKIFMLDDHIFEPISKEMEDLQKMFSSIEEKIGEITVKGEIFLIDDFEKKGCRRLRAIKNSDKKIEVKLYEIGYEKQGSYFEWFEMFENYPDENEETDECVIGEHVKLKD